MNQRDFTQRRLVSDILKQCQQHDPVDALHDLETALKLWKEHVDALLKEGLRNA